MFCRIVFLFSAFFVVIFCVGCSKPAKQGEWQNITFMDCRNITHKVSIKLTSAVLDEQTHLLKVEGAAKNLMDKYQLFNVRNWVYKLDDNGRFLKPRSIGLASIPMIAMNSKGWSREEPFTLIYEIGHSVNLTDITLFYADQFMLTGQINKIVIAVPLHVTSGIVTHRG